MILGGHQDTTNFDENDYEGTQDQGTQNQGMESPPRDPNFDQDEPAPVEQQGDVAPKKGSNGGIDVIKAGNYYALMSFLHLLVIDKLANSEGNEYYSKKKKNNKSSNLAQELFSEVPEPKSQTSLLQIIKFNTWCRQKRSMGGRLQAKKNPYNRNDGKKNNGSYSDYGLGYELMMVWHNMVFTSSMWFWMLSHFFDFMYTPFVMSVKVGLFGPSVMYWAILAMLFADSYDSKSGVDDKLIWYALTYASLVAVTSYFQKILSQPILDDYMSSGEYCDPKNDEDCCDPEEDSDCEAEWYDSDSDSDKDYEFDEDCEKGDTWCEDKQDSKRVPETQPETQPDVSDDDNSGDDSDKN